MTSLEKGFLLAVLTLAGGAAYLAFSLGQERSRAAELDARLTTAFREREELARALASAQKENRELDATLAKAGKVLDEMSAQMAAQAALRHPGPPPPQPAPVVRVGPGEAGPAPARPVPPAAAAVPLPEPAGRAQLTHAPTALAVPPPQGAAGSGAPLPPTGPAPVATAPAWDGTSMVPLVQALEKAAAAFIQANPGQRPTPEQLLPYLSPELAEQLKRQWEEARRKDE